MTICVLWDNRMAFHMLVEDATKCCCDAVSPMMLSAPFYRGSYTSIIIPTGFGNTKYSKLLPALRACSGRIEDYIENGGKLLVFGAADSAPDRYDWLPLDIEYHFEFDEHDLDVDETSIWSSMFDGYDTNNFAADGWFEKYPGKPVAVSKKNGKPILVECSIGEGTVILASTHEYPSNKILRELAKGEDIKF